MMLGMGKNVTLRDVARQAGVATATASRALDPSMQELVRPETIERVVAAAAALGYQPNSVARALKTNKTFAVGMLVSDLMNPFFPPMVRGIEDTLIKRDYNLLLGNTDDDLAREASQLDSMLARRVDGLILASAHVEDPVLKGLAETGIPVVLILRSTASNDFTSVTADDRVGVQLAVEHLVDLGHTRIAHIAGPQRSSTGLGRRESFDYWMRQAGIEPDESLVEEASTFSIEDGARAFATLMARAKDVTAVFAANDLMAIGAYDVAADLGLQVGRDISIVGYNDIPFAGRFDPPLTTVRLPTYDMGVRAAEEILSEIDGRTESPSEVRLAPSLVVRSSTTTEPS